MEIYRQKSWLSRNWLWFIPVSGCLGLIIAFIFGIGTTIFSVFKMVDSPTPVTYAMKLASKNEKVIKLLGKNIKKVGFPSGGISINNESGEVDYRISIEGKKGVGFITVRGIRVKGTWVYEDIYVTIKETQEIINLLEKTTEKVLHNI